MATTDDLKSPEKLHVNTTGEPTDQLSPEETETDSLDDTDDEEMDDVDEGDAEFDDEPIADDDDDLDEDEVKRLFPGEDSYSEEDEDDDEEPYEGIRHEDKEEEGLVDDNMSGMPVVPSPS